MSKLGLAFRTFFRILNDDSFATAITGLAAAEEAPPAPTPTRSDALTLLATLQREARFVDFVMEPLGTYADAQIGAAARDVHRDCAAVVQRLFGPAPLRSEDEGTALQLSADVDPATVHLTGRIGGTTRRGALRHHGWKATRNEVPTWNGQERHALIIAPAEVEITGE